MISVNELKRIAAKNKVALGVVEKDYALTWVLFALSESSARQNLIFKGGTALRKIYFPGWRYSEDLDFTALKPFKKEDFENILSKANDYMQGLSGMPLAIKSIFLNKEYAQIKLQFTGPLNGKNTIKIDISFNEKVLIRPLSRKIISDYSDAANHALLVYALEEILAEKIRSILPRGKTRDYFDVWKLLKLHHEKIDFTLLQEVLAKKCRLKGIEFKKEALFAVERVNSAQNYWKQGLAHQIRGLPDFKDVIKECKELVYKRL